MRKYKTVLILVICLAASVCILYGRTFFTDDVSWQSKSSGTIEKPLDDIITLHYHERPPYYITGILDVFGLCSDPAKLAFKKKGFLKKYSSMLNFQICRKAIKDILFSAKRWIQILLIKLTRQ